MFSRIKAILRRSAPKQAKVISYGGITLDENKHTVTVNGVPVSLTLKEYEILRLLMENPDQVFTGKYCCLTFLGRILQESQEPSMYTSVRFGQSLPKRVIGAKQYGGSVIKWGK